MINHSSNIWMISYYFVYIRDITTLSLSFVGGCDLSDVTFIFLACSSRFCSSYSCLLYIFVHKRCTFIPVFIFFLNLIVILVWILEYSTKVCFILNFLQYRRGLLCIQYQTWPCKTSVKCINEIVCIMVLWPLACLAVVHPNSEHVFKIWVCSFFWPLTSFLMHYFEVRLQARQFWYHTLHKLVLCQMNCII